MHISVILPTYNEKNNIVKLVNKIIKQLKKYSKKEIIIVDDSSPDGTFLVAKKNFKKQKLVKVFLRKKDFSLGKAIGYGIKKSKGKLIIVMDTDLTHDPIMLKRMVSNCKNYDLVSSSRYVKGGSMYSIFHFFFSLIFNFFLSIILKSKMKDNLGGYFCVKRSFIKKIIYNDIFYGYGEYFFRLLFYLEKNNAKMLEIPSRYNKRNSGKSKSNFIILLFVYFFQALILKIKNI